VAGRYRGRLAGTVTAIGGLLALPAAVLTTPAPAAAATPSAIQFSGGGPATPGLDRVMIRVDPPTAADLGATNFTIELWMRATAADNPGGTAACDQPGYSWISGRTLIDRDRWPGVGSDGRDYGVSVLANGRLAFGVHNGTTAYTLCSNLTVNVLDGAWHHVAVQRATTGVMQIWVDGSLRGQVTGPAGNVSYPDAAPTKRPASDPFLVIGAEKYDIGQAYRGLVDEVRLSTTLRYSASFIRPVAPFVPDAATAALYHFDGPIAACPATIGDAAGKVNGTCRSTGTAPALVATVPPSAAPRPPPPAPPALPSGALPFHAMAPARLADTRPGVLGAGAVREVQVAGRFGIGAGAAMAALNLTAITPDADGFLTAWPCGRPRPTTSNLNYAAGRIIANLATVAIGTGGRVCIYSQARTALAVDASGWWGPGGAGFGAVDLARVADTRPARVAAGTFLRVPVTGRAGVPATANAVAVTLTATGSTTGGFLTAWPCGQPRPAASHLNFAGGQTIANLAAVAVGAGGAICVQSSAAAAVIVDVSGWWGPGGLAAVQPAIAGSRLLDTRPGRVPAGGVVSVPVPAGIGVANVNVTVVGAGGTGWLAAYPCGRPPPMSSTLNYRPGQVVAGAALVPPGTDGRICVVTSSSAAILVDLVGGMVVAGLTRQAVGPALYALQWGFTQLGSPYAAINPYRFGDSRWGKPWPCPSGWPTCSLVDMHGGVRTADTGDWVYDCSGFVVAAFQRAGIDLVKLNAGWSDAMYRALPRVPAAQIQPGDLLLFGTGSAADPTTHVGMYLAGDQMLNATTGCGGWQGVCASRIDWTRVVAIARPPMPGTPGYGQLVDATPLDPYAGAE
jgi:hypothetical protein